MTDDQKLDVCCVAAASCLAAMTPGGGQPDWSKMTDDQKASFRETVRSYLTLPSPTRSANQAAEAAMSTAAEPGTSLAIKLAAARIRVSMQVARDVMAALGS